MAIRVNWPKTMYALVLSASVLLTIPVRANDPELGSMNSSMKIPDSELQHVQLRALQGSGEDAGHLVDHYSDYTQQKYWAQIAAENGDLIAEVNYANLLRHDPDPLAHVRAKFWYLRAKKEGYKNFLPSDEEFMNSK